MQKKLSLLCILDGFGHSEEKKFNAISQADTPNLDRFFKIYPHSLINTSGAAAGLPEGQMGNSEVGHLNIGSGRIMLQTLPKINQSIADDELKINPILQDFIAKVKAQNSVCHLAGILSDGGVHGHIEHLIYLANHLSNSGIKVWIHGFLDGRDTSPFSAKFYLQNLSQNLHSDVKIASLTGRYYAMDRDQKWERTEFCYRAIIEAKGEKIRDMSVAISQAYERGESDEFIKPLIVQDYQGVKDGDSLMMANFRSDRARQIASAFFAPDFLHFARKPTCFAASLSMTSYSEEIDQYLPCLFKTEIPKNTLSEVLAKHGLSQLHIAETEKYAHVTFFFNGGVEVPYEKEEHILIPSPKVSTYDLQPEMSAIKVTEKLLEAIRSRKFDFIIVNYANADMVGHTGEFSAAIAAIIVIDEILGKLEEAIIEIGGEMLITADHGNIEMMYDESASQPHTAHTLNLVPCFLVTKNIGLKLRDGNLSDIAPTILQMMKLPKPLEMTGNSLIVNHD